MAMPYSKTPGTLFFDRQNVTDFLNQFSDLCKDYKLLTDEKIKQFSKYYDMQIGKTIETMKEWKHQD